MNVLLINTSTDEYNLGLAKAANYWRSTRRASVSYAQKRRLRIRQAISPRRWRSRLSHKARGYS